jgi:large subunit ribosomal protein L4
MLTAKYFNAAGEPGDAFQLPEELFDGVVNDAVLHQVIKATLANRRQGNAATKTRANVAGGKKKAWRQKGTGRARQGSIRAPHWRGGGIVFGPHPRSYHQDVPRKVKALARRSAFNTKAQDEQVVVIERLAFDAPRTSQAVGLLGKMGVAEAKRVLVLTDGGNETVFRSFRNLPNVEVMPFAQASAYDVMKARQVVIEESALRSVGAAAQEVVNA